MLVIGRLDRADYVHLSRSAHFPTSATASSLRIHSSVTLDQTPADVGRRIPEAPVTVRTTAQTGSTADSDASQRHTDAHAAHAHAAHAQANADTLLTPVVSTADWMAAPTLAPSSPSPVLQERLGALAVLSAELQHARVLAAPSSLALDVVQREMTALPPQLAAVDAQSPFAIWMSVAALAEHYGAYRLAQLVVDGVRELVLAEYARTVDAQTRAQRDELVAICWARRGRIARMAGAFDDAIECYSQAARDSRKHPWNDAGPLAELGLATVSAIRGNIPDVERRAIALLARQPQIFPMYRVHAHQFLVLVKRKRGAFIDALLHAWSAYDLLSTDDFRRHELVGAMAEIALDIGDVDAASNGFDAVLATDVNDRIRVSSLAGAVQVCLRRRQAGDGEGNITRLQSLMSSLQTMLERNLSPNDRATALIALAEAEAGLGDRDAASRWLVAAAETAADAKLFERQFQIEALQATLRAPTASPLSSAKTIDVKTTTWSGVPEHASARGGTRHPALARLEYSAFWDITDSR